MLVELPAMNAWAARALFLSELSGSRARVWSRVRQVFFSRGQSLPEGLFLHDLAILFQVVAGYLFQQGLQGIIIPGDVFFWNYSDGIEAGEFAVRVIQAGEYIADHESHTRGLCILCLSGAGCGRGNL